MKGVKQTIQWMVCRPERKALLSPSHRRACIDLVRSQMKVSERRICRVLGQHRSTQRRLPQGRAYEDRLVADMIELGQYSRYGYRRVAALLHGAGWQVNDKRVERLWKASAAILSEAGMTKSKSDQSLHTSTHPQRPFTLAAQVGVDSRHQAWKF